MLATRRYIKQFRARFRAQQLSLFFWGVSKKKDEENFVQTLGELNRGLKYPLSDEELERTIISSLQKKDYNYRCSVSPCVDFCHKQVCKKRDFGIGKHEGYFSNLEYGQLFQYKMAMPYYEWEVRGLGKDDYKLLRFKSEEEILKQDVFIRLCMREIYELPFKIMQVEWYKKVQEALKDIKVVTIQTEDDTSPIVILKDLMNEFLVGRTPAVSRNEIFAKRAFYNTVKEEYWFRPKDLTDYIFRQKQCRHSSPQELHGILRSMDGENKKITTEDRRQIRIMTLPKRSLGKEESYEGLKPSFLATPAEEEEDF